MSANLVDFRMERLVRRAPSVPLSLSDDDRDYILRQLDVIGEVFETDAVPSVKLAVMPASAFVRHLVELQAVCKPDGMDQRLAAGRLESVLRVVESVVTVMLQRGSRRTA